MPFLDTSVIFFYSSRCIPVFSALLQSLDSLSPAIHGPPPLSLTTPAFFYLEPPSRSRLPSRHVLESSGIGNGAAAGRRTEKVALRRRPISRTTEADRITHVPYHRLSLDTVERIWNCKYPTRSLGESIPQDLSCRRRGASWSLRKRPPRTFPVYLARAIDVCARKH